jgi:hypothetical protein
VPFLDAVFFAYAGFLELLAEPPSLPFSSEPSAIKLPYAIETHQKYFMHCASPFIYPLLAQTAGINISFPNISD